MEFYKLTNNGNDFIITFNDNTDTQNIKKLCNRYFSIGADGLIVISKDNELKIYNSDGSKAKICGNGLICVSKLLSYINNNKSNIVYIDNKQYILDVDEQGFTSLIMPFPIMTSFKNGYLVNIENLHYIQIVNDIDKYDFTDKDLEIINKHKCNGHYITIINENTIKIKSYEYGANKTLSCGSGSTASFFVCNMLNKVINEVKVITEGGLLTCKVINNNYYLKGKAKLIYKGEYYGL